MIVCAAVKFLIVKNQRKCILCGVRHGDCYSQMAHLGLQNGIDYFKVEEGFVDADRQFYNREEAFFHAKECGQLSVSTRQLKKERNETELYSEDLY